MKDAQISLSGPSGCGNNNIISYNCRLGYAGFGDGAVRRRRYHRAVRYQTPGEHRFSEIRAFMVCAIVGCKEKLENMKGEKNRRDND